MEIKEITFAYADKINRIHDVTSDIKQGEITTIIGPNGSGKSTLLNVLTNNEQAQKGQVILDGKSINHYKAKELARVLGVVHQKNLAPAEMTVEQLIFYGRLPHKNTFGGNTDLDQEKVDWAINCTGLKDKRHMPIEALSGGQQQRVWIAMALAQDTPYLFLDEPTSNLDIFYQYSILELVKELNKTHGITILMVLHDINQAIQYSDQIMVMKDGAIFAKGRPETIANEQLIHDIYGVNVVVRHDEQAGMYIVPLGV